MTATRLVCGFSGCSGPAVHIIRRADAETGEPIDILACPRCVKKYGKLQARGKIPGTRLEFHKIVAYDEPEPGMVRLRRIA